ncbi:MAG TPA: GMC family oxidoreductase [Kofleriaceae bacterium]|nr:GMC family oxidoreductase [Kofleriaceae bacterium]
MIRSLSSDDAPSEIDTDVCVIGSGAAGVAVAREFLGTGTRVTVLESGGRKPTPSPDPLYDLQTSHLPIPTDSRVRSFGGTTTVWSGRWKRFDPIDFVPRDWVPRSGWPIAYDALTPYYERGARAAKVDDRPKPGDVPELLRSSIVVPTVFHTLTEAERDFGIATGPRFERATNVEVLLDAHVVGYDTANRSVSRVLVRSGARSIGVRAKLVVIATGGIENARQLLIANAGNDHDQVGRYYMDHPKAKIGVIETYEPIDTSSWKGLDESAPVWVGFRLADDIQRERRILNSYAFLAPAFERDLPRRILRRLVKPKICRVLDVRNYLEQEPDPDNRVYLGGDSDPLGLPKAKVAWTIRDQDRRTIVELHRLLARELQKNKVGELHSPFLDGREPPPFQDASHHMGTTRMGTDPRTSVVDTECRVHTVDNLFVAGSSVFPTSGYANPTATLVALAIRLADHLKTRL